MCYYLTAVLPPDINHPHAAAIAEQYGRTLARIANAGVQAQLRSGEQYFSTTAGHCDCDTSLGLVTRKKSPHQSQIDQKAKKLAAVGWSNAKIERALSQSARSQERSAVRSEQAAAADTESWIRFIEAMHNAGISYVGLLLHFYDGALSQNIQLKPRVLVPSVAKAREILPRITEDTLYEFRAEA